MRDVPSPNKAAPPNPRQRFAFAMSCKFDYVFCAPPSLSAAVGEPQLRLQYDTNPQGKCDSEHSCNSDEQLLARCVLLSSIWTHRAFVIIPYRAGISQLG